MTLVSPQRPSDDELVSRAASGDAESFSELVRRHRNDWYTLALRLLGNPDIAADVTQEVTIRCWKSLDAFRGDAKFSTWAHRIVVNTSWTHRRKAKRHRTTPIDHVEDPSHDPLEFHADRLGLRAEVSEALWALSAANRAVVVLKDVYGWSHSEIADALGITVTAAKVRLHRGRTTLRNRLGGSV